MKHARLLAWAFLAAITAHSRAFTQYTGIPETELHFKALLWRAQCALPMAGEKLDCLLPEAIGDSEKEILIKTRPVSASGEAASNEVIIESTPFKLSLKIYSVYPSVENGLPPYLQIQLQELSPARATCMQSVKWVYPFQSPTLICAGLENTNMNAITPVTQFGITLQSLLSY